MTPAQAATNTRALMAAAARLEAAGYNGDAYALTEALVTAVLADGYRPIDKPPPPRGPGASEATRRAAVEAAAAAVRAVKENRKKPATEVDW